MSWWKKKKTVMMVIKEEVEKGEAQEEKIKSIGTITIINERGMEEGRGGGGGRD